MSRNIFGRFGGGRREPLSAASQAFVAQPACRQELAGVAPEPWNVTGPELTELVRKEADEWAVKVKTLKLK